jgi:glucose-1-phosphate thymidylyltransferase
MPAKGIILAAGYGTRLFPLTAVTSKQLLPVYDKPMIYYPLANLMSAGIKEILVIASPESLNQFKALLGDGSQWGIKISFNVQEKAEGIPQAFLLAEQFLQGSKSVLMLGDNVLVGSGLGRKLRLICDNPGCHVFAYEVEDPTKYGNIRFRKDGSVKDVVEKPKNPFSRFAVPGLYFFDESALDRARILKKSKRGEYEVTDLINSYARDNSLTVSQLSRGTVWIDTGNARDLALAAEYIRVMQQRQGTYIACLEEIALRAGWIDERTLQEFQPRIKSEYANYVRSLKKQDVVKEVEAL